MSDNASSAPITPLKIAKALGDFKNREMLAPVKAQVGVGLTPGTPRTYTGVRVDA